MGMLPVLPGSTCLVHSPAVVQPQEVCTAVTSSIRAPTLVNTYVYLTTSPPLIWPKSYTGVAKRIFGPETPTAEVPSAIAESNDGAGAEVIEFAALPAAISPLRSPLPLTAYTTAAITTTATPIQRARRFVPVYYTHLT